jgi:phosphonate transport system permease protein
VTAARRVLGGARRPWFLDWPGLLLCLALAAAWRGAGGSLAALFGAEARRAAADFARGFWPPAHGAEFLSGMARPLAETVAIALLGMGLALLLGAPLSLAATSPDVAAACGGRTGHPRRALHLAARLLLDVMRSVPEIVWALLFVRALGIGAGAGVLAIGISYAGVVGKVFAEIFESTPRGAAAALGAAGAPPLRAFAFGILPAARPLLASYTLYRFDCALRTSAVLGMVGAGGVGQQVELSLKMLRYDEVAAFVVALFLLVAAVDIASQVARRRLLRRRSLLGTSAAAVARDALLALLLLGASAGSARLLDLSPGDLFSQRALSDMASYARTLWPPDLSPRLLADLLPAAGETLAVSLLGTALAAGIGLLLAWPAAIRFRALGTGAEGVGRHASRAAAGWMARGLLNLFRSLPELLWALLFIFAVGLGPFAGALALGVHTGGVLGRLYAEVLEEVPEGPLTALRAGGATPLGTALFGALPQAFPQLAAYTLYRWEVNIRAAAVLGVVGAGGLGRMLHVSLSLFDGRGTATLILAVLALVTAVDLFSGRLRARLAAGPAAAPRPAEGLAAAAALEGASP